MGYRMNSTHGRSVEGGKERKSGGTSNEEQVGGQLPQNDRDVITTLEM